MDQRKAPVELKIDVNFLDLTSKTVLCSTNFARFDDKQMKIESLTLRLNALFLYRPNIQSGISSYRF